MHSLLQKQEDLHQEATALLEEIIYPTLRPFGTVKVGGSYAYRLLNHPDIDLDVVTGELQQNMYAKLCATFLTLGLVSKLRTTDRVNFSSNRPGSQTGYWIAPEISYRGRTWNLDIWIQTPEWYTGNTNAYKTKLENITDEQRIAILSLKEELLAANLYGVGKEFQSVDVYEAVLEGGVKTVVELWAYKRENCTQE